jgi:hypothetical protein
MFRRRSSSRHQVCLFSIRMLVMACRRATEVIPSYRPAWMYLAISYSYLQLYTLSTCWTDLKFRSLSILSHPRPLRALPPVHFWHTKLPAKACPPPQLPQPFALTLPPLSPSKMSRPNACYSGSRRLRRVPAQVSLVVDVRFIDPAARVR